MEKNIKPQTVTALTTIYAMISGGLIIRFIVLVLLSIDADKSVKNYFLNYIDWLITLSFAIAILIGNINFYKMKELGRLSLVIINWVWIVAMTGAGFIIPIVLWIIIKKIHLSFGILLLVLIFLVPTIPAYFLNYYLNKKDLIKKMK